MSDKTIILDYELTQNWADRLKNPRVTAGREIWAYYALAFVALVALCTLILAIGAISVAVLLDVIPTQQRLLASVGGVTGMVLVYLWASRIHRLSCQDLRGVYKVGTRARYEIGPDGLRLQGDGQDWHTGWQHVRDFRVRKGVLTIWTPFTVFALSAEQIPLPVEDTISQMRAWQAGARI
jgi:hypothetical protein